MANDPKDNSAAIDQSELVEVFASIDPMQMRMARDLLEESGIECFVFDREKLAHVRQQRRISGPHDGAP